MYASAYVLPHQVTSPLSVTCAVSMINYLRAQDYAEMSTALQNQLLAHQPYDTTSQENDGENDGEM